MRKIYAKSWIKSSLLLLGCLSFFNLSNAQVTGIKTIPTDYATIAAFVADCNATGIGAGGTTLNVPAGHTEINATAGGIQLTATGTAADPIIIQKSGAGANPIVNSALGVANGNIAVQDGIFALVGSDFVTLDGINFFDANSSTATTTMEWGIGMFKVDGTNGCNNNTIRNCVIALSRVNNSVSSGPAFEGSKGINVINATILAQATAVTPTTAAGTNSNNKFFSNTIVNTNIGISLSGFAAATPFTLADTGNDIGGSSLTTGNTINEFGGAAAAANPAAGVRAVSQYALNVSYNNFANNPDHTVGENHLSTLRGILIGAATSASATINNNTVQLVGGGAASLLEGISNASGSTAAVNTININSNTLRLAYPTATSGGINGILNSGSAATVNINSNTITNVISLPLLTNVLAGTGTMIFINNTAILPTLNINSNTIQNLARTGASGTTRGIVITSPTNVIVDGNTIENITYTLPTSTGSIDGIYGFSSSVNVSYTNNIVRNLATPVTGTIRGLVENGISGTKTITGNQVYGFATTAGAGNGGATFTGINAVQGNITMNNNLVYQLNSTGATGGTIGAVNGILISGGVSSIVSNNKIYDLSTKSTGAVVTGIVFTAGTSNTAFNNVISDLRVTGASNLANGVIGINVSGGTTANVYFNSVLVNTATTGGALFGTSALLASSTVNLTSNNNILINTSTPTGATGFSTAFRRTGLTTAGNFTAASNRNLLFAGTPSVNNLLFYDGTNSAQTIPAYQALVGAREANTFTESVAYATPGTFFINTTTGASADFLKPVAGIATQAESGGVTISTPAITSDYASVVRSVTPDLGAYEFAGTNPAPIIATITVSPAANECVNTVRGVGATITTPSGTITTAQINYSVNGVAQTPIPMTLFGLDIYTGTIPVVSPANAAVVWSISVTNSIGISAASATGSYTDEPLTGFAASASASLSNVCVNSPTDLSAVINNPAASLLYSVPVIPNPAADEDLRTVRISQGATVLLDNSSTVGSLTGTIGLATGTAGSYSNYSSFPAVPVVAGQTYNLFVASIDAAATFYANYATAFIDYNGDGDFADAGESLIPSTGLLFNRAVDNGNDSITASFTIPATAINGLTRIRVAVTETGQTDAVGVLNNAFGEFEDYMINISGGAQGSSADVTSVTWFDGATNVGTGNPLTVNPTAASTTYSANITAFGCVLAPSPTVVVTTTALPSSPTATNSAQCGTAVATASVTSTTALPTPTFNWYAATSGGTALQSSASTTYTTAVTATTTFYVSELNTVTGCESPRTPVTVTVATADLISAASTVATTCLGTSFTLTAANVNPTPLQSYAYTWTSVAGSGVTSTAGTSISVTPTLAGTYTYSANGVDGSCNALATVIVTVNPLTAVLTPVAISCNGYNDGTFTLGATTCATGALTYSVDAGAFGAIPTNLTPGAHTVIVKDANGIESASISITVTEPAQAVPTPTVTAVAACIGATVANVTATSVGAPLAQTPIVVEFGLTSQPFELSSSVFAPPIATTGNIISSATLPALPAGAVVTGVTFTMNNITALGSSYQSDVRFGFTGAVSSNYASSTIGAGAAGNFNYSLATIPTASVNIAGGLVNLNYHDYFNDNAAGDEATFPIGASVGSLIVNYTLPNPSTLTWWDAATAGVQQGTGSPLNAIGTLVLPAATTPGTYTLYAQANNATCTNLTRTPVVVTINALPTISAGTDQTVCANTAVTLTATSADAITWAGPVAVTNGTAFTPPVGLHTFIATATSAAGCTKNDTVVVTVNALPVVNAGIDQTICAGTTATLTGSGSTVLGYVWTGPVAVTDATPISPNPPVGVQTFTVTAIDANLCINSDSLVLTVNALPVVTTNNDTTICAGFPVTFTGAGAATYSWNGPIPITNGVAFNAPAGLHTFVVTGTSLTGCTDTDTVILTVNPIPTVLAGADQTICVGSSVTLTATAATTYAWAGPEPITNGAAFTPPTGIHTFIVTGTELGCTDTDTVIVTVNQTTVLAGVDTTICAGSPVTFTATGASTYSWNGPIPIMNGMPFVAPVGVHTFVVTGTSAAGCVDTDTIILTVNALPTVIAGIDQTVCSGTATTLTASGAATYSWNGPIPITNGVAFTAPAGNHTFIVTGTNALGCVDTDTAVIVVNALPVIMTGPDQSICAGTSLILTATGAPTITWAGPIAITNGVAFVAPVGVLTFTATGTSAAGCVGTDAVTITVNALPVAVATVSGVVVTSTTTGVTYQWVNCPANTAVVGATSASYTATVNGNYAVITTNASGCKDTSACVVVSTVSLEDVKGITNVNIAPNPTTGEFTVSMSNVEENTTITVLDAAGKVINVYANVTSTTQVDLTTVQTGIYMVEVRNANGSKMYRVAKN